VDFVLPRKGGGMRLIEAKASVTVTPGMTVPMQRLAAAWKKHGPARQVEMYLVHEAARGGMRSGAIAPGVRAIAWQELVGMLR